MHEIGHYRYAVRISPSCCHTKLPFAARSRKDRGRDTRCRVPPAQIRACRIPALGSYLKWLTANLSCGQGWETRGFGSHVLTMAAMVRQGVYAF